MKKIFVLIIAAQIACHSNADAQIWKKVADKVKQTVSDKTVDKAGNATSDAYDKATDIHVKKGSSDNSNNFSEDESNASPSSGGSSSPASIKSYTNYDFVPGDTIIFQSNLTGEQVGEIPSQFTLSEGQADIQNEGGENVIHVSDGVGAAFIPRMKNQNYIPDRFTIEFDYENSKEGIDYFHIRFGKNNEQHWSADDGILPNANFYLTGCDFGGGDIGFSDELSKIVSDDNGNAAMKWHHIAIAVNKNAGKMYVDQYRVINVNNLTGKAQDIAFNIEGRGHSYIKNIRIAAGGIDIYKTATTDAKIIMHGINFDVDKATIKPESMGSINEIYNVMKSNPSLKYEIGGHTDNTGDAAHNLTLSQQRADAVRDQLVKMGIDGTRLTTKGYGDTKPISDNSTEEGKANNRRVEFVKQ